MRTHGAHGVFIRLLSKPSPSWHNNVYATKSSEILPAKVQPSSPLGTRVYSFQIRELYKVIIKQLRSAEKNGKAIDRRAPLRWEALYKQGRWSSDLQFSRFLFCRGILCLSSFVFQRFKTSIFFSLYCPPRGEVVCDWYKGSHRRQDDESFICFQCAPCRFTFSSLQRIILKSASWGTIAANFWSHFVLQFGSSEENKRNL